MPKCDFNKAAFLRLCFPKGTSGRLLVNVFLYFFAWLLLILSWKKKYCISKIKASELHFKLFFHGMGFFSKFAAAKFAIYIFAYVIKMALIGLQNEPVSLDVNEVYFEEKQDIPNMREKSRKIQSVTEWCRCGKWDVMRLNVEYFSCVEVEALGYFQLSDMR